MNEYTKCGLSFLGGAIIGSLATYLTIKFAKKDIHHVDPEIESQIKATKDFTSKKPPIEEVIKKYEPENPPIMEVKEETDSNVAEEIDIPEVPHFEGNIFRYPQTPRRLTDREINHVDTDSPNTICYMVTADDILTVIDDNYNIISEEELGGELGLYEELIEFARSDDGSAGWIVEPVGSSDNEDNAITFLFDKTYSTYYEITGVDIYNYHK